MTDNSLKKLNRIELLEILVAQSRQIEELEQENARLKEQLQSRKIEMENVGSLADAAVQISRVLEAAQNAAELYLENIRRMNGGEGSMDGAEKEHKGSSDRLESD